MKIEGMPWGEEIYYLTLNDGGIVLIRTIWENGEPISICYATRIEGTGETDSGCGALMWKRSKEGALYSKQHTLNYIREPNEHIVPPR